MRVFKLSCNEEVYRVEEGDTFQSIAERFNTVAENIAAANGFGNGAADGNGAGAGGNTGANGGADGNSALIPGDMLFIPDLECPVYTVGPLDTAEGIAKKFGVSVEDVVPGGRLYIGQRVVIKNKK